MSKFSFKIEKKSKEFSQARVGKITTPHGSIQTPAFVVVGTKATVKGVQTKEINKLNGQTVLANTYHLYLQPGSEVVRKSGGLGRFMNYDGPTWTDSGGFQVLSLGAAFNTGVTKISKDKELSEVRQVKAEKNQMAIVNEEGVTFKSVIDGSKHFFTPEKSVQIQHELGADIFFAFDECTSPLATKDYQEEAMQRTYRWAKRSLEEHKKLGKSIATKKQQAIFGVVQGSGHIDLRSESAKLLGSMDFDGYGIGGSFTKSDIERDVSIACKNLPENKPRHLLGIGEPEDFFAGVESGIDTFDCVIPTRLARHGTIYTFEGKINLKNSAYKSNFSKITRDKKDPLYPYTFAYLSHLYRSDEMLAGILASEHNIYFLTSLVDSIRKNLKNGTYRKCKDNFLAKYLKK